MLRGFVKRHSMIEPAMQNNSGRLQHISGRTGLLDWKLFAIGNTLPTIIHEFLERSPLSDEIHKKAIKISFSIAEPRTCMLCYSLGRISLFEKCLFYIVGAVYTHAWIASLDFPKRPPLIFIVHSWHFDVDVNAVKHGTRYPFLIFGNDRSRTSARLLSITIKTTRAGIHTFGQIFHA